MAEDCGNSYSHVAGVPLLLLIAVGVPPDDHDDDDDSRMVKHLVASVCPSVRPFVSTLSFEPTDLTFGLEFVCVCVCVCVKHDHSSPDVENQDYRSKLKVNVQRVWV